MKMINALALVVAMSLVSSFGRAATYQEVCAQQFVNAGYSQNGTTFAELCEYVNNDYALSCVNGLIRNNYDNISQDVMNACTFTTYDGQVSVNSLFDHRYSPVDYDLIKAVASAHSAYQANCMVSAFNQGYSNLTGDNIVGLCP